VQPHIELRRKVGRPDVRLCESIEHEVLKLTVLKSEEDLEQRLPGQVAFRLQLRHQLLKGRSWCA